MNKIVFKIKSITDVITNSSTEVFTIYDENGIKSLKELINTILSVAYSTSNVKEKLYFDDLFDVKFSIEYDYISDEIEEYIEDHLPDMFVDFKQLNTYEKEYYDFIEKNIPYETLLEMAKTRDDEDWEGYRAVCGLEVKIKDNVNVDKDLIETAAKLISNIDSTFEHNASYC